MSDRWQCMACGFVVKGAAPPARCPSCGAPFTAFVRQELDPRARLRQTTIVEPAPPGRRYVIIGNSAAGRSAARAIQALDPAGSLTVISEESAPLYYRPLLPDFIGGMKREDFLAVGSTFSDEGLELIVGDGAAHLDVAAHRVVCVSGRTVPYDRLLLATGSAPVQIPWPGSAAEGIAYFRTFADAERIAALAAQATHAVVVGGGLLGLEFVRAFLARGVTLTQIVREAYVGFPALDAAGGPLVAEALAELGVVVMAGRQVAGFESEGGRVCAVLTEAGERVACDLVGIAIGARPRVELAQEVGAAVDRGVLVDRRFRTSVEGIYAAGDVAQAYDRVRREPRVNTSWRNSQEQGELAGIAMAGGAGEYAGAVAVNYQLAAGLPFFALGIANPEDPADYQIEARVDEQARTYRKTVTRDGVLVGACLIGDLGLASELEQRVREAATPAAPAAVSPAVAPTPTAGDARPDNEPAPRRERAPEERDMSMHEMTRDNLQAAFAGESQAHVKYLSFAQKATKEGKENVARLFRAASYAEQMHATRHLAVLRGVAGTGDNLVAAMAGESHEVEEMYPAFLAVAVEQDEAKAQESLNYAFQAEKVHLGMYERARTAVEAGGDAAIDELWVCSYCGFTMEGQPPDTCPLCNTPKNEFVKF